MQAPRVPFSVGLAAVFALGVAFYVWKKGGIGGAASAAGAGVVDAAGSFAAGAFGAVSTAASGAVDSAGAAVTGDSNWNLGGAIYDATHQPTSFTDRYGAWVRNFWGIAPTDPNAAATDAANVAETARLIDRYPAPAPASNAPTFDASSINWMMGS